MSLQYKTEVYIRKAIRQAQFGAVDSDMWFAALPAFGLEATGDSKDDAERNLLIKLCYTVLSGARTESRLPIIEGIDLTEVLEAESLEAPPPEVLVLTARESRTVAQALEHPPEPTEYLREAARAYRDFTSQ